VGADVDEAALEVEGLRPFVSLPNAHQIVSAPRILASAYASFTSV
jgi:hypothetical protein